MQEVENQERREIKEVKVKEIKITKADTRFNPTSKLDSYVVKEVDYIVHK